jgi:hypothetical protein
MPVETEDETVRVAMWAPTCAPLDGANAEPPTPHDVERGWRFVHMLMTITGIEARQSLVCARALGELLIARGLVSVEELQAVMERVQAEVEENPIPKVTMAQGEDKYLTENNILIDCLERLPVCRARCCTFGFCLTEQDLDEGVARWDYGQPYWIRKRPDGYCAHCEPETHQCRIFEYRPFVCRVYDCRNDRRIWHDFERCILAPCRTAGNDQTPEEARGLAEA